MFKQVQSFKGLGRPAEETVVFDKSFLDVSFNVLLNAPPQCFIISQVVVGSGFIIVNRCAMCFTLVKCFSSPSMSDLAFTLNDCIHCTELICKKKQQQIKRTLCE